MKLKVKLNITAFLAVKFLDSIHSSESGIVGNLTKTHTDLLLEFLTKFADLVVTRETKIDFLPIVNKCIILIKNCSKQLYVI